jgi:hypothetical protein
MERSRVTELHYITPLSNIGSIVAHGLLCHNMVKKLPHQSVASQEIQDRRVGKRVPGGLMLHDYANLYLDARNPMMYVLKANSLVPLGVVRIMPTVLDLPGAVISDGNAAASSTRFFSSPAGLTVLDESMVFARYWTHADHWEHAEHKRIRCAEVLIPYVIPIQYLKGVFVQSSEHAVLCGNYGWCGEVYPDVFFR